MSVGKRGIEEEEEKKDQVKWRERAIGEKAIGDWYPPLASRGGESLVAGQLGYGIECIKIN